MDPHAFHAACKQAATDQGLDVITIVLAAAGVAYDLDQTGGFTMAVTVPVNSGTYALTNDSIDPDDESNLLIGFYAGNAWNEMGDPEFLSTTNHDGIHAWAHTVAALQATENAATALALGVDEIVEAWESGDLGGAVTDAAAMAAEVKRMRRRFFNANYTGPRRPASGA